MKPEAITLWGVIIVSAASFAIQLVEFVPASASAKPAERSSLILKLVLTGVTCLAAAVVAVLTYAADQRRKKDTELYEALANTTIKTLKAEFVFEAPIEVDRFLSYMKGTLLTVAQGGRQKASLIADWEAMPTGDPIELPLILTRRHGTGEPDVLGFVSEAEYIKSDGKITAYKSFSVDLDWQDAQLINSVPTLGALNSVSSVSMYFLDPDAATYIKRGELRFTLNDNSVLYVVIPKSKFVRTTYLSGTNEPITMAVVRGTEIKELLVTQSGEASKSKHGYYELRTVVSTKPNLGL